jgi:transketolase C-terminal domain/subunit
MFADNGLSDVQSWLYFPADPLQMVAVIERVFFERGLRFVFSTRAKVPYILKEDGQTKFFGGDYKFVPGKDDTIVDGKAGYVVSFGEMLYRSWDAVLRCREQGLDVGLINKSTLNLVDEQVGSLPFVTNNYPDRMNDRPSRRLGRVHLCLSSSLSIKRLE